LANYNVSGAMANPTLALHDSTGAQIISNDNWTSDQSQEVAMTGFAPIYQSESAIVATLPAGSYTVILRGVSGASGVALFELYDLDPASSRIINMSTRGKVETGDSVLIGGFIIGGEQPTKVIVRAIGPSLTPYGISDALVDPILELHNGDGSLIFQNDNWRTDQEQQILDSGLTPSNNLESAIVATLQPGNYTAIVRSVGNSTGIALFEVYNLD
jgi:hypothetical protein